MLPPRTTGWRGSAARTAAVSEDVVVLPLVPVTPIVGAGHSRRNRSTSRPARGGRRRRRRARRRGPQRRTEPRLGRRVVGVDRRRASSPARHRPSADAGSTSGPSAQASRPPAECRDRVAQLVGRPPVVDRHPGARVGEEARQRDAARANPRTVTGAPRSAPIAMPPSRRRRDRSCGAVVIAASRARARRGEEQRHAEQRRRGCRRSRSGA